VCDEWISGKHVVWCSMCVNYKKENQFSSISRSASKMALWIWNRTLALFEIDILRMAGKRLLKNNSSSSSTNTTTGGGWWRMRTSYFSGAEDWWLTSSLFQRRTSPFPFSFFPGPGPQQSPPPPVLSPLPGLADCRLAGWLTVCWLAF